MSERRAQHPSTEVAMSSQQESEPDLGLSPEFGSRMADMKLTFYFPIEPIKRVVDVIHVTVERIKAIGSAINLPAEAESVDDIIKATGELRRKQEASKSRLAELIRDFQTTWLVSFMADRKAISQDTFFEHGEQKTAEDELESLEDLNDQLDFLAGKLEEESVQDGSPDAHDKRAKKRQVKGSTSETVETGVFDELSQELQQLQDNLNNALTSDDERSKSFLNFLIKARERARAKRMRTKESAYSALLDDFRDGTGEKRFWAAF